MIFSWTVLKCLFKYAIFPKDLSQELHLNALTLSWTFGNVFWNYSLIWSSYHKSHICKVIGFHALQVLFQVPIFSETHIAYITFMFFNFAMNIRYMSSHRGSIMKSLVTNLTPKCFPNFDRLFAWRRYIFENCISINFHRNFSIVFKKNEQRAALTKMIKCLSLNHLNLLHIKKCAEHFDLTLLLWPIEIQNIL